MPLRDGSQSEEAGPRGVTTAGVTRLDLRMDSLGEVALPISSTVLPLPLCVATAWRSASGSTVVVRASVVTLLSAMQTAPSTVQASPLCTPPLPSL